MDVTVAVVAYNEEANISDCLKAIQAQTYRMGASEILVIDGRSTDRTRELVSEAARNDPRIRLLDNPARQISAGRNIALLGARFPFLAFTDADCRPPSHWLETLVAGWKRIQRDHPRLAGVGGGNRPPSGESEFLTALGVYLDSTLGSFGSVQGRNFSVPRSVASVGCFNALFDRQALQEVGGFDASLGNMGEDLEIGCRLRRAGFELWYVPGAEVIHRLRSDLFAWARNMFAYGRGRAFVSLRHHQLGNRFFLAAWAYVLTLVGAALGRWPKARALLALYVGLVVTYAGGLTWLAKRSHLWPRVAVIFLVTHFAYGCGMVLGTIHGAVKAVLGDGPLAWVRSLRLQAIGKR